MTKILTWEQFDELDDLLNPNNVEHFKLCMENTRQINEFLVIEAKIIDKDIVSVEIRHTNTRELIRLNRIVIPKTETGNIFIDKVIKFLESK